MAESEKKVGDTSEEGSETAEQSTIEKFISSPEGQKLISQGIQAWKEDRESQRSLTKAQMEAHRSTTRGATWGLLLWTFLLVVVIIIPVAILAWNGKISSDATTFLLGTVVGAAFTFLRGFFPTG